MALRLNPALAPGSEPRLNLAVAAALGLALTGLAVAVTAFGGLSPHPWLAAAGRGTIVAVPLAIGLYAWSRRPYERFGRMLAAVGVGWSLTALAGSSSSVLYSTGRVAGWLVEVGFIWLILAFPSGRLTGRWDRGLVAAYVILVLVGYLPTALLGDDYPAPSPWSDCRDDCPANAFQIIDAGQGFVADGLPAVREALTILVFIGAAIVLAGRIRSATRLMRLVLTPVLAIAATRLIVYAGGFAVRRADVDSAVLGAFAWTIALLMPAMAVAFLIGLLRWQLFAGAALQRLARELHAHPDADRLRAALARTLEDPSLRLAFWKSEGAGSWVDADGDRFDMGTVEPDRLVTTIYDGDKRMAAIVHDVALGGEPEFIEAAGNFAAIALDNHRLVALVRSSLREVQESRARIMASADEERRRIERDLHDGAQQRLVALRIKLELAQELLPEDPKRGRELLHDIGDETVEALEDVRSLAHGVYPAVLTQRGLPAALRDAALRSPIPVRLDAGGVGRYPPEIESALYFCCMEAMQNAAKHGLGASLIAIGLSDEGQLRFQVTDDGAGFDAVTTPPGTGIANMRDRLEAVGGELSYRSEVGRGTRVVGIVPTRSPQDA
jgi:signal transduction histidine kinase